MKIKKLATTAGFTLIELLITISIISVLSTFVMYQTSDAKLKAEDAHMRAEAREVEKAVALYREDHGEAPFASGGGSFNKGDMIPEDDPAYTASMEKLVPKYLPEIPTSPSGTAYSYMVTPDGYNAVFAADLNYPPNNSGDSYTYNFCEWVEDEEEDEWPPVPVLIVPDIPEDVSVLSPCPPHSPIDYQPTQPGCYLEYTVDCHPWEGIGCLEPVLGEEVCATLPDTVSCACSDTGQINRVGGDDYVVEYKVYEYSCEIIEGEPTPEPTPEPEEPDGPVCSGSNSTDYCSCI